MSDDFTVPVFAAHNLMEAELVKGLLEGEKIRAYIPQEGSLDPMSGAEQVYHVEVHTSREDAERAREVLRKAHEDGEHLKGWLKEEDAGT